MATSRTAIIVCALAALALSGCGREEPKPAPAPAAPAPSAAPELSAAEKEYNGLVEEAHAERVRLMKAAAEARKRGDAAALAEAEKAILENRRKAADLVREHRNLSSKEQTK